MNIAFATSLFAENDFDEFLTINFAEKKEISAVQFYMNANLQANKSKIEKIRNLCREKSVRILCHSPQMLGNASADTAHCEALASLFYGDAPKYCVFHFDENREIENMISDCEKLINLGITPCVENFYINKTRHGLVANLEKFLAFFDRISVRNLPVIPVLDFPRLFIEQFANFHPILLSELLIQKFARKKIIIHAIDSVSPHQNREDWCAIGRGIVGWLDIFDFLKMQGVFAEFMVLEYENTLFIDESIEHIKKRSENFPLRSL
jgi:sugar phosphate isomerase/epimerase